MTWDPRARRSRRAGGPRALPLLAAVLVLGLTGCASTVDSIERLGRKAAERVGTGAAEPAAASGGALPRPEANRHG
ncbi:hypothetical protein ACFT0G_11845 [Streptomyces sp. NPDC057020]|uniref:hypothetical protein n=1 Tax=unclassified Streptomyces TaxID=2593676 RepID=UPI00093F1A17|nr:hypothetical protein [Streptomyces sp. CB02009]OKJ59919.1 hypothetical protein AMK27_20900 [Streptomyces sp. CB02009]